MELCGEAADTQEIRDADPVRSGRQRASRRRARTTRQRGLQASIWYSLSKAPILRVRHFSPRLAIGRRLYGSLMHTIGHHLEGTINRTGLAAEAFCNPPAPCLYARFGARRLGRNATGGFGFPTRLRGLAENPKAVE